MRLEREETSEEPGGREGTRRKPVLVTVASQTGTGAGRGLPAKLADPLTSLLHFYSHGHPSSKHLQSVEELDRWHTFN